jgi:hypothetical protein
MSTAILITHRRMERSPGSGHEHVGWVKLMSGEILTRDQVFVAVARGIAFNTYSPLGAQARVIRVHCTLCSRDYLRTMADQIKADNLDALPLF